LRVLEAEDDSITRRLLESHLIKWGHDVVIRVDGGEAWDILTRDDGPKLAILDWMMPLPASGSGRSSFIPGQGAGPQPGWNCFRIRIVQKDLIRNVSINLA